ncbi:universal stress protein [Formosa sediminum]|uniref:Universal stress protein n=1 Tax=Formosa sediminum TaxID=2594004 RepID=A0A516GTW9_9FLAO|nr:universal stress protein [Formosa sediminum]QDO94971.1 universal stress protein [Formosa sediminum]
MKNILLPTDFSENAWNAIEYALQLFKEETCNFYIIHSFDQPDSSSYMGVTSAMAKESIYNAQVEFSKQGLRDVLAKVKSTYPNPNHTYKCVSIYKQFKDAVKKVVVDYKIDCIVMGTKGASAIKEITVGSNTAGLIGVVNCPIIAIPKHTQFKGIKEIGISTDYDIEFTEKGLQPLMELAKSNASLISVFHIMDRVKKLTTQQEEKSEILRKLLSNFSANYFTLTDIGVITGVRAFVQSRNLDLLCVIAREQDFLKRILNQSYSKTISSKSNVPLLILNVKNF